MQNDSNKSKRRKLKGKKQKAKSNLYTRGGDGNKSTRNTNKGKKNNSKQSGLIASCFIVQMHLAELHSAVPTSGIIQPDVRHVSSFYPCCVTLSFLTVATVVTGARPCHCPTFAFYSETTRSDIELH